MNCDYCNEDISGQAHATVPCCSRVYHTTCMIKHVAAVAMSHYHYSTTEILCGCHNTLYTHMNYSYNSDNQSAVDINTILSVPVNSEKVKQIKKTGTMMKKACSAFSKVLAQQKRAFKEGASQYLNALRELRANSLSTIKQSTEYKEYARLHRSYFFGVNTFRAKHKIGRSNIREVFGETSRWRYAYGRSPARLLRQAFRIRG
jgi:hypothetical protein